jgi:hypothetical protein
LENYAPGFAGRSWNKTETPDSCSLSQRALVSTQVGIILCHEDGKSF